MNTKILVVDDDPMITNLLKENFETEGHSVALAHDASAAIDRFAYVGHAPMLIHIGWQQVLIETGHKDDGSAAGFCVRAQC